MSINGKVAIVTGGAKGIGRGIAEHFAKAGAKVVIADIDEAAARATAEAITASGGEAIAQRTDVTSWASAEAMAAATLARFGRIDVLCSNAGIYPEHRLEDMTPEQWDRVLAINLKGAFLTLKACLPPMKHQKGGRVIITSSITGNRTAVPALAHYAASKGGVNGFIRAAAFEMAKHNITVNGVEPGMIDTDSLRAMGAAMIAEVGRVVPLGRIGRIEDVAAAMTFLASDAASYITGQTIVVDGGLTLSELQSLVERPGG